MKINDKNLLHTIYTYFSKTAILWLSLFVMLALALLFALPRIQQLRNTYAISNGDVTLGPSLTINDSTNISSSIANLGTDHIAYRWVKGASDNYARINIPFDNSGATDFSGYGHNGVVTGTSYLNGQTPGDCVAGGCRSFNGSSDGIEVTHTDNLNFFNNDFTAEAWVNFTTSQNATIIGKRKGSSPFEQWGISTSGVSNCTSGGAGTAICLYACNGTCSAVASAAGFDDGNWHHVVATKSGDTFSLYVNDTFVNSFVRTSNVGNTSSFTIGRLGEFSGGFLNGKLDEVKVYNRVLSAAEITQSFTDGSNGISGPSIINSSQTQAGQTWNLFATEISNFGTIGSTIEAIAPVFITGSQLEPADISLNSPDEVSAIIPSITTPPAGNKVAFQWVRDGNNYASGYWPFHDNTVTQELDISGNQNHSVGFTGTPTYEASGSANCQVGNCYTFNGSQNIRIDDYLASNDARTELSVFAWVKANPQTTRSFLSQYDISGNGRSWYLGTGSSNTDKLRILLTQNGSTSVFKDFYSSTVVWDNTLQHVGFTFNNGDLKLFVNGVEEASPIIARNDAMTTINNTSDEMTIGSFLSNTISGGWTGSVDEVMTFAKALSQEEITQIYNDGVAGNHAPTQINPSAHAFGETWGVGAYEIGSLFGPMNIGNVTIASAPATTVSAVAPSGVSPFAQSITINFTCSLDLGGSALRDLLVEYSDNSGASFSSATITSATDGSISGSTIQSLTCDGGEESVVWDSFADNVALSPTIENDVQIRITPQVGSSTVGISSDFTVSNPNLVTITANTSLNAAAFDSNTIYVVDGATLTVADQEFGDPTISIVSLIVQNSGVVTHTASTNSTIYKLDLTASSSVSVDATSSITANHTGLPVNFTFDGVNAPTASAGGTGSHGGFGGGLANQPYGSFSQPITPGGGGGLRAGGGIIKLTGVDLTLNGTISSSTPTNSGGNSTPAGGSVWLDFSNTVSGSGSLTATGGFTTNNGIPTGSGGRIAVYYDSSIGGNPNPTTLVSNFSIDASGGPGGTGQNGAAGTIYLEEKNEVTNTTYNTGEGYLLISNTRNTTAHTPLPSSTNVEFLYIQNFAEVEAGTLVIGDSLIMSETGNLFHPDSTAVTTNRLTITAETVNIGATATIDLSARGFLPGYIADNLGNPTTVGGATGTGPGSHGGLGGTNQAGRSETYGSITQPIDPGAGNGSSEVGGGAVRITTDDLIVNGEIRVTPDSNSGSQGGAAGGSIWLTVNDELSGTGRIDAESGGTTNNGVATGGGGRIAIYYDSSVAGNPTVTNLFSTFTISASSGIGQSGVKGSAGTIYVEELNEVLASTYSTGEAYLYVHNNFATVVATPLSTNLTFESLFIEDQGDVEVETITLNDTLQLTDTTTITHPAVTTTTTNRLIITAQTINVGASAQIVADNIGFLPGYTADALGNPTTTGATLRSGSHGGLGGTTGGTPNVVYGSHTQPTFPGAGSNGTRAGGGAIQITTGDLILNGELSAATTLNPGSNGGGAGGSLWVTVTGALSGSGVLDVSSAGTSNNGASTGGGGRLAFYYNSSIGTNPVNTEALRSLYTFTTRGGPGGSGIEGGSGTLYVEDSSTHASGEGDLVINNENVIGNSTPGFWSGSPDPLVVNNLSVLNQSDFLIDAPCSGLSSLTVNGSIDLSGSGEIINNQPGTCGTSLAALSITALLSNGEQNVVYSQQVVSPGGYAPKTFECLDGLGGSVIACNPAAGLPSGLTMNTTGLISGTPTTRGTFNPIIRVTDSDPGGAQVVEQTLTLFISGPPNAPTLVSPANTSQVGTATPTLSAQYSDVDPGDTGTTNYRISSSSLADCQGNTNIVDSGTSTATASNNEATSYTVSVALSHATTYFWCAQNNDGTNTSGAFTQMGEFTVNLGNAPNEPTIVSPGNGDTTNQVSPLLEVNYSDPDGGDVGTSEFRVSSGSSADCLSNTNIVFTGSSATTTTNNETTSITVGVALTNLATYNWCARNNDGIFTSNSGNFTTMGSFLVDTSFTDGGSLGTIIRSNPGNGGGGGDSDPNPDSTQSDPVQTSIDQFDLTLLITDLNGNTVSDSIDRTTVLFGQIDVFNSNSISASNVFVNLPIPSYVQYVPGSLLVNDVFQSDTADSDIGQGNQNAVSGIWADIPANQGATLSFQLVFDLEALTEFEQAQTAVSPTIQLQASLSADNANQTFLSNIVDLSVQDETESPVLDIPGGDGDPDEDPDGRILDPTPEPPTDGGGPDNDPNSEDPEQPGGGDSDPDPNNGGGDSGDVPDPTSNNPGQPGEGDPGSGGGGNENDPDPNGGNTSGPDANNPSQPGEGEPGSGGGDGDPGNENPTIFVDPIAPPPEIIVDGLQPDPGPMIILMPISLPDPNGGGGGPGSGGGSTNPVDDGSTTNPSGGGLNDLVITGTVQSRTTDIELTGTVNAPNAEVTVIINNKSFSGLSDENGLWRAFVSAEEIGVNQGETIRFEVQAFAKKDVRESNRIVSDVILSLTNEGLIAEPVPQVSANSITRASIAFVDVVEENQEDIQTAIAVTAPVVLVSSISLWGYLPYLPTLFFHFVSWMLSLFRKRSKQSLYGIVYDAITKQPLPLAIIRVYKDENGSKKLVSTQVSNKEGRYELLIPPGNYSVVVSKPSYLFPSKLVSTSVDGKYEHVYSYELGLSIGEEALALPDFPLDPVNVGRVKQRANILKRLWLAIQHVGSFLAIPILFIGLFASIGMLIIAPENILNWILAFIYLLMLILQLIFRSHPEKPWGVVYDLATNAPLPLTTIQLIDPDFGKVIKSRLADYQGRFSFLPSPGKYVVKASKDGYYQAEVVESRKERIPMKDSISIEKEGDTITGDIGMKQQ